MCGITGGIFFSSSTSREQIQSALATAATAIHHRGPDCTGISLHTYTAPHATFHVGLGQLRLAIIDLSPGGQQPMYYHKDVGAFSHVYHTEHMDTYADRSLCITFNGEIYNYQDIKTELETAGYLFSTKSDTEVILAAYHAYGPSCVEKFNGMRAFALYDPLAGRVFCSRDRLGKKPFYYTHTEQGMLFASEIKGLLATGLLSPRAPSLLDQESLELYLNLGYIPSPRSIYTDIKKLPARHNLLVTLNENNFPAYAISAYDSIPAYAPLPVTKANKQALIAEGKTLLADAVKIRMFTADVPVGAFLSGGLDSSSVVGEMTKRVEKEKLNTFSVGFEGKYDESNYITIVKDAFGTTHHHVYFRQEDFDALLQQIAYHFDEPLGDPSVFPTYLVSKLARQYVTVSLSGDGGDEMFGGYPIHAIAYSLELLRRLPRFFLLIIQKVSGLLPGGKNPFSLFGKIAEACKLALLPPSSFFAELLSGVIYRSPAYKQRTTSCMNELLARNNGAFAQSVIDFDLFYNTLADNFLVKADRASMAHALEVRAPFLDRRFIAFTRKIPVVWKAAFGKTKILLREIICGIVPDSIVQRGKQGFTPPIEQWILQEKYTQEISNGIENLHHQGILSHEWHTFYTERALKRTEQSFVVYKIRMFFLLQWMKEWLP